LPKGQRNTRIPQKVLTPEEKAHREKHNERAQQGREKKKHTETWWVELQKHFMTAKDHQDALFDQAKMAEESERVEKMFEANDLAKGKKKENKFDMSEHLVEDEEEIELPKKPSKKKSVNGKRAEGTLKSRKKMTPK
jgi:hypothetical protein